MIYHYHLEILLDLLTNVFHGSTEEMLQKNVSVAIYYKMWFFVQVNLMTYNYMIVIV